MANYESVIWTPRTPLTATTMNQMADNDNDIQTYANSKRGYGDYFASWNEPFSIGVDPGTQVVHFDADRGNYHITVHNANEIWKFGVNIGNIRILNDAAAPAGSTGATLNAYGIGTEGYNQCSIRLFNTMSFSPGTQTRMCEMWAAPAYGIGAAAGNPYGNFVSTLYNTNLDIGICGQILYQFTTPGLYLISTVIRIATTDVNTININHSNTSQSQIFAKCMG